MHPKRVFAIFYVLALLALLVWAIVEGPQMLSNVWWTDWSRQSHDDRVEDIGHEFQRKFIQTDVKPTEEDWAKLSADLKAVPQDK